MQYLNISFYRFVRIEESKLPELREQLLEKAKGLGLKGTLLLATEGLNGFLAGSAEAVNEMKNFIRSYSYFSGQEFKDSYSDFCPFTRMFVKIKKEIISMGVPDVVPYQYTAPRVKPTELKNWIESGKEIVFLDTRNDYEVNLGTFKGALDLKLKTFRQFPEMVKQLPENLKDKTIVTFCTGGIRCEKAAAYMETQGFKNVYQIDGGILKYFEEAGGLGYEGECFIFDHRVAIDKNLNRTDTVICYKCSSPVTAAEQKSDRYLKNKYCPYCKDQPVFHKEKIAEGIRNRAI